MSNNMNIKFTSNASRLSSSVNSLGSAMDRLGKAGKKTTGDFRSFQKQTRKLNDAFSNMARDGNRTTKIFKGMTLGSMRLSNVLGVLLSHRVGAWLRQGIKSAMEMIETNELFRVSLGNLTTETDMAIRSMSELTGLDTTNLRDRVANFNLLAKTMGMTSKNSQTLGLNMNQLALDMGAVFNVSYAQVAEDLRSGLVGQSRVLYKYGIDVTNAQLAEEARARGITKSVNKMSQYEKMMLRHQVILKQTTLIQGEFAKEFNFPMNQLRIFQERFVTLSRTIGQLFLPAMGAIVRVANGVVIALTNIFNAIGAFFGIKMNEILEPRDVDFNPIDDEVTDSIDNVGGGLGKANKEAKKLKKQLAGFDELNIIQTKTPESPSTGDTGVGGGQPLDFDLSMYDGMLDKIEDSAKEMSDKIMAHLRGIWELAEPTRDALSKLWTEGLSKFADFSMGTLMDFYNSFLVPIASWQLTDGLPRFFNIINDMLNEIDWDRLRTSLSGLFLELGKANIQIGTAVLDFLEKVLKPIGIWNMGIGLPTFIDTITRFLSDIDWERIHGALNGLWDAITPFAINVGEGLLWFLDNVLRPLATIVINDIVPAFLDTLTKAITALNDILIYFQPAFEWFSEKVLLPLATWTGGVIVTVLEGIGNAIKFIGENINIIMPIVGALGFLIGMWKLSELMTYVKFFTGSGGFKLLGDTIAHFGTIALTKGAGGFKGLLTPMIALGKGFVTFLISPMGLASLGIIALVAVGVLLYKNWDVIKEKLSKLGEWFSKKWNEIKTSTSEILESVKNTISDKWNEIQVFFKEKVPEIIGNIVDFFSELPSKIGYAIGYVLGTLAGWGANVLDWIGKEVPKLIKKVVDFFAELPSKIKEKIDKFKDTIFTWVSNGLNWIGTEVPKLINRVVEFFAGLPNKIKEKIDGFKNTLSNWVRDGIGWVTIEIPKLLNSIINFFAELPSKLVDVGANMIKGIWNGMLSMGSWLADKVMGLFGGLGKFVGEIFSGVGRGASAGYTNIRKFADGGVPNMGEMFIAREAGAELVGNFGGRTAVMNNDDIVYSVTKGVYQAVKMAMGGSNTDGQPIQLVVNVLGDTVMDKVIPAIKRESIKNNKLIIDV